VLLAEIRIPPPPSPPSPACELFPVMRLFWMSGEPPLMYIPNPTGARFPVIVFPVMVGEAFPI